MNEMGPSASSTSCGSPIAPYNQQFHKTDQEEITMSRLETPFPNILTGTINSRVVDPEDPGTPQTIIETDDSWYVDVDWDLCGPLAPVMCGQFTLKAYSEDIAASQ